MLGTAERGGDELSTWGRFLAGMSIGDWITSALLLVAVATLVATALSQRRQAQALDVGTYLQLMDRYTNAWRRFRVEPNGQQKDFEFVEVLNLMEGTCHLYNVGAIRGATRGMIRDYLRETLPVVFGEEYEKTVATSFSGPDTYFQIRRFARTNNIEGVPQQ